MADIVTPAVRSRMMASVRGRDTTPEVRLRSALHRLGFRFRKHDSRLPGKPDVVLRKWNAVLFVNGCFWHGHDCELFRLPKTRRSFWNSKINRNRTNDTRNREELECLGWRHATIWECSVKGKRRRTFEEIADLCARWLESRSRRIDIRGEPLDARSGDKS